MKTSPLVLSLAAGCALLVSLIPLRAQEPTASIWREIGAGSASDNGLSNETLANAGVPAAAIDGTSVYVAWESGNSEIFVRQWTGAEWVQVGPNSASGGGISNNAGHSRFPSIAIGADHLPVVAWLDDSSGNWEVYLRRFNTVSNAATPAWAPIAGSGEAGGLSKALGAIASPDGAQPVVGVGTQGQLFVAWAKNVTERHVFVSTPTTAGSAATSAGWNVLGASVDIPSAEYVAENTGTPAPQYRGATRPSLVLGADNAPVVAYVTESSASAGDVHVRRWNGSSWQPFGPGAATNAGISGVVPPRPDGYTLSAPRLAIAPNGQVHASWLRADAEHKLIYVRRSTETGWVDAGPPLALASALPAGGAGFGFSPDGSALVAWTAATAVLSPAGNSEIYLSRLVTTATTAEKVWQEFGAGSASGGGISANPGESAYPFVAFARSTTATAAASAPVVVWLDGSDSSEPRAGQIYVRRAQSAATTVEFSQATFTVSEAAGIATIGVVRKGLLSGETRLRYVTHDGTATAGSDYTAAEGELVFAPNEATKSFPITIARDDADETNETVALALGSPSTGSDLGLNRTATLVISNSAPPPPPNPAGRLQFKVTGFAAGEGSGHAVIEVVRVDGSTGEVSVGYETVAATTNSAATGVATPGSDYTSVSGSLVFATGVTSRTFEVPILEDTLVEGRETLGLRLSTPTGGATLGTPAIASLAIEDNDQAPPPTAGRLGFKVSSFVAGEGSGRAVIEVVRTEGSTGEVSVAYETAPFTGEHPATADADYTPVSGTLVFAAGVASRTFEVPILEDTLVEGREAAGLRLSNPTGGATLAALAGAVLAIEDNDATPAATIQFDPVEYHIAENGGAVQLRVTRSAAATVAASVEYFTLPMSATSTGVATPGADFEAVSGTLTFTAGESFKTISVPIKTDTIAEPNEIFAIGLKNPQGATLGAAATARVVIESAPTNNSGILAFAATEFRVIENAGVAEIAVVRKEGSTGEVSVTFSTADAPTSEHAATADVDYTSTTGTLTFAAGETRKTFTVPILDDTATEGAEILSLTLSAPTGGASLQANAAKAALVIADDDQPAGTLAFAATELRVREGAEGITLIVARKDGAAGEVSVSYATADGTAKAGSDYTATAGTLTFAAGQLSRAITIPIRDDSSNEGAETFTVTLRAPTGGAVLGTPATATVTIIDHEPAGVLQLARADYTVSENGHAATITVTRSEGAAGEVSVNYATADGTALADADYTATSGTLTFPAGVKSKSFTVPILDDTLPEAPESFSVLLSDVAGGATLGALNMAKINITDNDLAPKLQFAVSDFRVREDAGKVTISVFRRGSTAGAVRVKYATKDGTALAGQDYTAASGTLEFGPGQTVKKFDVLITRDTLAEGTESVQLTLSEPEGGAILGTPSTATLTIVDPTAVNGSVQFAAPFFYVNEAAGTATITVTRQADSTGAVSVKYSASAGTAAETEDFTPVSGTLSFGAGEKTKSFTVPIVSDALTEGLETVLLDLSDPTGGALLGTPSHAVLNIVEQNSTPGTSTR
ncbi:MAG: hypothetical protein QOE70_972 [Chthoniobacter sp.]|jgi:hypothetical protein|nr:hypothetical protein [Chthoniobacter sp.]